MDCVHFQYCMCVFLYAVSFSPAFCMSLVFVFILTISMLRKYLNVKRRTEGKEKDISNVSNIVKRSEWIGATMGNLNALQAPKMKQHIH